MPKLRKDHRPEALRFDWKAHGTRQPFAGMWGALTRLSDATRAAEAKARELSVSADYTPSGRAKAKRDYALSGVAPTIKEAAAALDAAEQEIARIRSTMAGPLIDKSDLYSAGLRREIRDWLRAMPDNERSSMLVMAEQLDPTVAAAIVEQLPELSGVTPAQHARLRNHAIGARYPEAAQSIAAIDAAAEALDYHVQSAMIIVSKELGVPDIKEMVGLLPSVEESIAARLAEGVEQAA